MCQDTRNIYLCGHDDTEHLWSCPTYRRFRGSRKALGRNRRIPNHETTSIDRRYGHVCDRCRVEGRRAGMVYVRAALNPPRPAPPPRTPSPILDDQRPDVLNRPPPLLQPFPNNAVPRPRPLNPLAQFPAGGDLPLYSGISSLPRVRGPNGLVYVVTPEGFAPLDTFVEAFSDILYQM